MCLRNRSVKGVVVFLGGFTGVGGLSYNNELFVSLIQRINNLLHIYISWQPKETPSESMRLLISLEISQPHVSFYGVTKSATLFTRDTTKGHIKHGYLHRTNRESKYTLSQLLFV